MGSWARGIESAKGSDRGDYLPEGTYDCEVVYTTAFTKRNGGGILAKVRLRILASNNPEIKELSEQDMCFNCDPSRQDVVQLQLADIRGFVMAAEGSTKDEVTEEVIYYVFEDGEEGQACTGKKIRVVATNIETKKGSPFTKYKCTPFNEALHMQLKTMRGTSNTISAA